MAVSDQTRDYALRLFDRQGDRALFVVRGMIAHLRAIRDPDRLNDWRRVHAEIERLARVRTSSPSRQSDTEALQRVPRARKVESQGRHAETGFWRRVGIELERIKNQQQIDSALSEPGRSSLDLQMTTADKDAIKPAAATEDNRSVAREIVYRLDKSFEPDRLLSLASTRSDYAPIFERLAGLARRVEQMTGKAASNDIDTARAVQAAWVAEIECWWWHPDLPAPATINAILQEAEVPATDARPLSKGFEERTRQLAKALKAIFEEEWAAMDAHAIYALTRAAAAIDR